MFNLILIVVAVFIVASVLFAIGLLMHMRRQRRVMVARDTALEALALNLGIERRNGESETDLRARAMSAARGPRIRYEFSTAGAEETAGALRSVEKRCSTA